MAFSVRDTIYSIPSFYRADHMEGLRDLVMVYKIHDSGDQDGEYTVTIRNNEIGVRDGAAENYTVRMLMTAKAYEAFTKGIFSPEVAFMTGDIRYIGNILAHEEMQKYLKIPKGTGIKYL